MSKTLLQISASLFSDAGQSTQLSDAFVAAWQAANPGGTVVKRDLAREPVPHLTAERFQSFLAKPEERTAEQRAVHDYSIALIDELQRADVIALGVPMYNFGVPSTLKAYFDHIARAGITFRYTEKGPEGLLAGKKLYVFATRGGMYAGTAKDTQTPYLRDFLGLLGITDVEFVYAEGLAITEQMKTQAVADARAAIDRLVPVRLAA